MLNFKNNMMPAAGGIISKNHVLGKWFYFCKRKLFFMKIVFIGWTKKIRCFLIYIFLLETKNLDLQKSCKFFK